MRTTSNVAWVGEFAVWVGVASITVVAACVVGAYALGDGAITLKYVLFVVGFILFGLGGLGIQPKSKRRDRQRVTFETERAWDIENRLAQLSSLRSQTVPFEDRVSRDTKLLATSLVVLGVSLSLELVADVGV